MKSSVVSMVSMTDGVQRREYDPRNLGSWQRLFRRNGAGTGRRGRTEPESRGGHRGILTHGEPEAPHMPQRSDSVIDGQRPTGSPSFR